MQHPSRESVATDASLHRLPAVNDHGLSEYEGGRIRTQPENGIGDLFGLTHPSDWLLIDHRLAAFFGAAGKAIHH